MKIDRDLPAQETQLASAPRLRLSREATFDRTMEQMEAAMWQGGKVGTQPAAQLPQHRSLTGQAVMLPPVALGQPAGTIAMEAPASVAPYIAPQPTVTGQANAAAPTGVVAIATEAAPGMLPATVAAPLRMASGASPALDESPVSTRPLAVDRSQSIDDQAEHRVTWAEGPHGPELVIRQSARDDARTGLARDALAQIRRHGLLPRRITVNGVVTDDPHRHGEST